MNIGRCLNFVTGFKNAVTKGTNWHNWSDEIVWKFQITTSKTKLKENCLETKKKSLKFVHHLTRLILNMAWLLLLSSIIYYSSETQAVDIHAPPDIGSHLRHFEGADKNPQFLTFPVNESLDEDAVPCWNASTCAYTIYPVLGCFLSEGLILL